MRFLQYLKICRPIMGIFGGFLAVLGYQIYHSHLDLVSLMLFMTTFFGLCGTMVLNNFFDRFHDVKKGEKFAFRKPQATRNFAISLFLISATGGIILTKIEVLAGLLFLNISAISILYSFFRHYFFISALTVAFYSASLVFFGPLLSQKWQDVTLILWILVFIIMLAREIIKDLKNHQFDIGYKNTLPLKIGVKKAESVAIFLILIDILFIIIFLKPVFILSNLFLIIAGLTLFLSKYGFSKTWIDIGMLSFLIIFFINLGII